MHVNFVSSNDTGEIVLFLCGVMMKKSGWTMKHDIIKGVINSFLNNYQKEEIILRNGSNLKVLIYCLIIFIKQV